MRIIQKIVVFLVIVLLLFTKDTKGKEYYLGVKGGLNLAWIEHYGSYGLLNALIAFHGGIYGVYMFNNAIGLQLEMFYSEQGEIRNTRLNTITDKTSHINIPLLYKYHFPYGFRIYVGPQVSFLVNATEKIEPNTKDHGVTSNNNTADYSRTDLGLVVGMEHAFNTGLTISARYNVGGVGITYMYKKMVSKLSHRVLQLSVGYNFAKQVSGSCVGCESR